MSTFGERVRDSMLAAGLRPTPENLAQIIPISVPMARRWLKMREANVLATRLAPLAKRTRFRMYWLATGEGFPQSHFMLSDHEREAMRIANALDDSGTRRRWLHDGAKKTEE